MHQNVPHGAARTGGPKMDFSKVLLSGHVRVIVLWWRTKESNGEYEYSSDLMTLHNIMDSV